MSGDEVPEPILNSPFDEPTEHRPIVEGETPARCPAMSFYCDPKTKRDTEDGRMLGPAIGLQVAPLLIPSPPAGRWPPARIARFRRSCPRSIAEPADGFELRSSRLLLREGETPRQLQN